MTLPSAESFFSGGGESIKYNGDVVNGQYVDTTLLNVWRGGRVISDPVVQQRTDFDTKEPLFWKDGLPKLQLAVTLRCAGERQGILDERNAQDASDLGDRTLYIKGYMQPAVRDELRRVGVPGISVGGELYICWYDIKPTGKGKPARLFKAKYIPPTVALPQGGPASMPAAPPDPWGQAPAVPQPTALTQAAAPQLAAMQAQNPVQQAYNRAQGSVPVNPWETAQEVATHVAEAVAQQAAPAENPWA